MLRKSTTPPSAHRRPLAAGSLIVTLIAACTLPLSAIAKDGAIDPGVVPDQYIVVFNAQDSAQKSAAELGNDAKQLALRHGGELKATYSAALKGFTLRASTSVAKSLALDPAVATVMQDLWMEPMAVQQSAASYYHLDRVDQPALPLDQQFAFDSTRTLGQGVTVYVMDGAIHAAHPDFGEFSPGSPRLLPGVDFTGLGNEVCTNNPSPYEDNHGTLVAGIAAGLEPGHAKAARIQSLRVLDCNFSSTLSTFLAAVDWLTLHAKRPSVINMSLAFNREATFMFPVEQINLATAALQRSISTGLIYVTASGNRFPNAAVDASVYFPASVPEVITVGATDYTDRRAPFSNYGPLVDLHAPGVNVRSSTYAPNAYGTANGTSFAAPAVAGTIARLLGMQPYATAREVEQMLIDHATTDALTDVGPGTPNRLLYTRWLQESLAEECNFNAWTSVHGAIATGVADPAQGFSRVLSPCGIRAQASGDYLENTLSHPLDQYTARFYVIPATGGSATIFKSFGENGQLLFDVRVTGSLIELRPGDGSPSWTTSLRAGGWNSVEVRWQAGAPGTLTMEVGHLVIAGSRFASTSSSSSKLFPSGGNVARVQWGMIDGQATAPLRFDAFVSKYGVADPLGRVCRCDANLDGRLTHADLDEVLAELAGQRSFGHVDCNEDGVVDQADSDEMNAILKSSRNSLECPI